MIVAVGGRKHSGKTLLVDALIEKGYKKLSFARRLKEIICELYNIETIELLNELKEVQLEDKLPWDDETILRFSEIAGVNPDEVNREKQEFSSVREALQYIGTDVLRKIDINYHVKATFNNLDLNKNYCLDDMRFSSELEYIQENFNDKFDSYFLIRPYVFNISNHISERELSWKNFNNILINDSSVESLMNKFKMCYEYNIKFDTGIRRLNSFYDVNEINKGLFDRLYNNMHIYPKYNEYSFTFYDNTDKNKLFKLLGINKNNENYCIKYMNSNVFKIINPFLIENIKKWIEPIDENTFEKFYPEEV